MTGSGTFRKSSNVQFRSAKRTKTDIAFGLRFQRYSLCSESQYSRMAAAVAARAPNTVATGTHHSPYAQGIDALLRELANPNLHDIVSMQNRVELWTADGQHVRWAVAATANITIGYVAFEAAVRNWPHERFTLRQGALLIREHPVMR